VLAFAELGDEQLEGAALHFDDVTAGVDVGEEVARLFE
jgi:hypothetical protein